MENVSFRMEKILRQGGNEEDYVQHRLMSMIEMMAHVIEKNGYWRIDENGKLVIDADHESSWIKSTSLIQLRRNKDRSDHYLTEKMTQSFYDEKWLQAMCQRINTCLSEEERAIFLSRYFEKRKIEQILKREDISRRRYYQLLNDANEKMIEEWNLNLFDRNGKVTGI